MIFNIFQYDFTIMKMFGVLIAFTLVCILSLSFHELAHAFVAYKQGDMTPKLAGRLTLNPLAHIDSLGFVSFLLIGVGWAKPVPVNPTNFKKFRSGIAKVSIAGVVANLILCVVSSFLYILSLHLIGDSTDILVLSMEWMMYVNAFLIVFNLIPIYPLDGFNFISSFMKSNNKFIEFNVKNSYKILLGVLIVDLMFDLFFGVSIIGFILNYLASLICVPLCKLWWLIF